MLCKIRYFRARFRRDMRQLQSVLRSRDLKLLKISVDQFLGICFFFVCLGSIGTLLFVVKIRGAGLVQVDF